MSVRHGCPALLSQESEARATELADTASNPNDTLFKRSSEKCVSRGQPFSAARPCHVAPCTLMCLDRCRQREKHFQLALEGFNTMLKERRHETFVDSDLPALINRAHCLTKLKRLPEAVRDPSTVAHPRPMPDAARPGH